VKNLLAEKIFMKCSRITMKRSFGLGGAIEMFPRFSGHLLARNRPKISETHLVEWFFNHSF